MPGHELIGTAERERVIDVFDRGGVFTRSGFDERREGVYCAQQFETAVADRVGTDHALFVSSGTAALKLALWALGVREGDEVITQSHTFVATVEAALELGADPVVVDVDDTLNMDPADLERNISEDTAAVVPVHMYGVAANLPEILDITDHYDVPVLEDSAWGLGSTLDGLHLGTFGDVGIYSLNYGKTITTGQGGLLVTDEERIYQTAKEYHNHGHKDRPDLPAGQDTRSTPGFNYKTDELGAAVGLAQLKKLDTVLQRQNENKEALRHRLSHLDLTFRERPNPDGESGRTLALRLDSEETAQELAAELADNDIGTINLPGAIDWHFAGTWHHVYGDGSDGRDLEAVWSQSSDILRSTVALPVRVRMSENELDEIAAIVERVLG